MATKPSSRDVCESVHFAEKRAIPFWFVHELWRPNPRVEPERWARLLIGVVMAHSVKEAVKKAQTEWPDLKGKMELDPDPLAQSLPD